MTDDAVSRSGRPAGGVALWRQIADRIRDLIETGAIEEGVRLPSEAELALRFSVNRHTVRAALSELAREDVVETARGRGTFVRREHRLTYPIARRTRFSAGLDGQARDLTTRIEGHAREPAAQRIAQALDIAVGTDVVRIETVSLADRRPVSRAAHFFPALRFASLPEVLERTGSITRALEALGIDDYVRRSTRIGARRATTRDAQLLDIGEGGPVLVVSAVNTHEDRPIQFSLTRFAGDRLELAVESDGHA